MSGWLQSGHPCPVPACCQGWCCLPSVAEFTPRLFTDAAIMPATPCQKPHGSMGACTRMGGGLLACYYPFTRISWLISFQMGRINWFRLEHQACLIEMSSFPFPNGHFHSVCCMGMGGGCSLPVMDPHGTVQLGCSEPAGIAVPFSPLSIWEGALISPRTHPARMLSQPPVYS